MKTQTRSRIIASLALTGCMLPGGAAVAQDWQEKRLLSPSVVQQRAERQGSVYLYEGLYEDSVDRALDTQFGRIQNMMFVGVRHKAPDATGYADDDCD